MRAVNTRNRFHLPVKPDLGLEHLWVVYPGSNDYSLDEATDAVPLAAIKRVADDLNRRDWYHVDRDQTTASSWNPRISSSEYPAAVSTSSVC